MVSIWVLYFTHHTTTISSMQKHETKMGHVVRTMNKKVINFVDIDIWNHSLGFSMLNLMKMSCIPEFCSLLKPNEIHQLHQSANCLVLFCPDVMCVVRCIVISQCKSLCMLHCYFTMQHTTHITSGVCIV